MEGNISPELGFRYARWNGIDTLQRDMNSRDAIISFQYFADNLVRVIEVLHGKGIQCLILAL